MTTTKEIKLNNKLTKRIHEIMENVGWMTFPQLIRVLKGEGFEVEGNHELAMTPTNVKCWFGLSEELANSFIELFTQNVLRPFPATPQLYGMENLDFGSMPMILDYPQANLPKDQAVLLLSYISIVRAPEEDKETPNE